MAIGEGRNLQDNGKTYCIKVTEERMEIQEAPDTKTNEAIVIGDLSGYISDVNQAALKLFGADSKSELVGKHVLEFVAKDEKARVAQNSLEAVASGKAQRQLYHVRTKARGEIAVAVTIDFIKDKQGENIGFIDIIKEVHTA